MDIGKIFECLEEDYRTFVVSIAMAFPMAYVDCWKLVPTFRNYEIFPQIMLSLGIAVMFVMSGIINVTIISMTAEKRSPSPGQYHVTGVLYPLLFASVLVAAGFAGSISIFLCFYGFAYFILIFLLLIINLLCAIFPKKFK